eukprot:evm.model.scf_340.8 EVM.evm.TU.scf_340.8   scf_340:54597-68221(-)
MEADAGAPMTRLMIRQMVLENFKSYAGSRTIGPFDKSFTAVVGPNGSGKSNVIDAMLFVFGKRAKKLRLNKVSELIHKSSNYRHLQYARVSVHFQEIIDKEGADFDVVQDSNFVISRVATIANKSDYEINGRKSSFTEVTNLLKAKGVDLDNNRFLILQGEVEMISQMKPMGQDKHDEGLLEYLEDIMGTNQYVEKLEEASKSLEDIDERRQSMLQRLRIVEDEKSSLEAAKNEALAFLAKDAEIQKLQIADCSHILAGLQENMDQVEAQIASLQGKLQAEKEGNKSSVKELAALQKTQQEMRKRQTRLEKEHQKEQGKYKEQEKVDLKFAEEQKHLATKLEKLKKKEMDSAQAAEAAQKDIRMAETEIPQAQSQAEGLQAQLQREEQVFQQYKDGIKDEVESHLKELSKVQESLSPWERQMQEVRSKASTAQAEKETLAQQQAVAEAELAEALRTIEELKARPNHKRLQELEAEAQHHRQLLQEATHALQELRRKEETQQRVVREMEEQLLRARQQNSDERSQGGIIQALMEARRSGQIPGLHGRLGDLGAIDAKYDVAISTACGALDHIVVESTEDGQAGVQLLRNRQLGVATFLILSQQARLEAEMQRPVNTPEGLPRLFDLVQVGNDRDRVAFYFALRNTLVANDLEQATRIAYGSDPRFRRIVTLKGELINESGTITGGGGRPRRGRMTLGNAPPRVLDRRAREQEIKQLDSQVKEARECLEAIMQAIGEKESAQQESQRALSNLETTIPVTRMEAEADEARSNDLQRRLGRLQKQAQPTREEIAKIRDLDCRIQSCQGDITRLEQSMVDLRKMEDEIKSRIENAGGTRLRNQKEKVEKLQEAKKHLEMEIKRKEVLIASKRKQMNKMAGDIEKCRAEGAKTEEKVAKNRKEKQANEDAALLTFQSAEKVRAAVEEAKEELQNVTNAMEGLLQESNAARERESRIEIELEDVTQRRADVVAAKRHHTNQRAAYVQRLAECAPGEPVPEHTPEELATVDVQQLRFQIVSLKEDLEKMNPNTSALNEFRTKEAEAARRKEEFDSVTQDRDKMKMHYEGLRKRRLDEFMTGFNIIGMKLKENYQMLTLGGDAELELVDSLDPFSEGIVFSVRPPKKSWKNIANLSGGEKTLSSLALVFALHHYKPTPVYVMDEIDAALDFKNVSIVGHYVKERTKGAQFIIISLRNNMFELADRLTGVYKVDNCSNSLTMNPRELVIGGAHDVGKGQQTGTEPTMTVA